MRSKNVVVLCAIAGLLAACGDKPVASVAGGECKAFQRAAVEACGLTQADQDVLDDFVETGVSACKWKRPQPRVPSCADLRTEIMQRTLKAAEPAASVAPPKKTWKQRFLGRQ